MKNYCFDLDQYERDNLLWLIDLADNLGLDSGAWLQQVRNKLYPEDGPGDPDIDRYETEAILVRTGQIR